MAEQLPLVGRRAPKFEVDCIDGADAPARRATLNDYDDRWLIVMFYPHDFSLVCPTELSAMSARTPELEQLGTEVLAISTDPIDAHRRWLEASRAEGGVGPLNFPLASDRNGAMAQRYGVYVESRHCALRGLFIIDSNGVVQYQCIHGLSVGRAVGDILRVLKALQTGGLCPESWTPEKQAIDPAIDLRPGHVVSNFRIETKLGEGGFATVFRAVDLLLDRRVALKVLKRTDATSPAIEREARAAAALSHPNICTVHALGDLGGVPMIVMEYLEGSTLSNQPAGDRRNPENVRRVGAQIASGMSAAHRVGVIHGDLKPANVFVTGAGVVKILDFGLARRRRIALSGAATVSASGDHAGQIVGTPAYMAPEVASGGAPSEAGDVFALGLILYELLAGRQAFDGSGLLEVLEQVRLVDPEAMAAGWSAPFDSLLRRMLAPNPDDRTIAMSEVENELGG